MLSLGNLDAKRDWGHAQDYVEAMWLMLQHDEPLDLVIATGETYSVRDYVNQAFKMVGVDIEWKGSGIDEIGFDSSSNRKLVKVDPKFFRPAEVEHLHGDAKKLKQFWAGNPKFHSKTL